MGAAASIAAKKRRQERRLHWQMLILGDEWVPTDPRSPPLHPRLRQRQRATTGRGCGRQRAELAGNRVAWSLRLPLRGDPKRLAEPCFSCREGDVVSESLPEDLAWLASTFGDCFVETDCSGTAPWGVPLGSQQHRMFEGALEALPASAANWVVLYEADGDWLCADLESGKAHWSGHEWTGRPDVGYPTWRSVMHFVFWRILDGGFVRPTDLEMLFAASQARDPRRGASGVR